MKEKFYFEFIELYMCMKQRTAFFERHTKPKMAMKYLLLEFIYGYFPEKGKSTQGSFNLVANEADANVLREALMPYLPKFYKGAKKDVYTVIKEVSDIYDEEDKRFIAQKDISSNRLIVSFCLGVWPENTTKDVVLDANHIKELREALRMQDAWLLKEISHNAGKFPTIPGRTSPHERVAVALSISTPFLFEENLKMTKNLWISEEKS